MVRKLCKEIATLRDNIPDLVEDMVQEKILLLQEDTAEHIEEKIKESLETWKQENPAPTTPSVLPSQPPPTSSLKTLFEKFTKSDQYMKWKNSCLIHDAANSTFFHLTTTTIEGYYIFKPHLTRGENTLLYIITKVAIDNKIIDLIIKADARLSKGADGKLLWEKLHEHFKEAQHDYTSLLHILTLIQA
eukprot:967153-Ditylum_brightwellii.AAC.1